MSKWSRSVSLLIVVATLGCGTRFVRFPLAPPMWADNDEVPFSPRPPEWYSSYLWDGAEQSVFRPLSEVWTLELDSEAINVNSFDEVPNSSWYTNRLSRWAMSPSEVARGACLSEVPEGPFVISAGKPDGASPGFFVRDERGVTHLMKVDGTLQPERASAADAIVAAIYWAAGYYVPCNRVIVISRDELELEPGAEARMTNGHREPLTREIVERILAQAAQTPEGNLRMGLSEVVAGEPIAPWRYSGVWDADPNDVVPHEHRRELRGMYVLASWVSRIDSRQENTLASWIAATGDHGFVRHYVIDFGDALGVLFPWDRLSRRFGHSGYLDIEHIVGDLITFGAVSRSWDKAHLGPAGSTLGFFDVAQYEPGDWRPGYPNPAFDHLTERDAAWMARILARFTNAHIDALVERARFSEPRVSLELLRVLIGRRNLALERWLTRVSPLAHPTFESEESRICVEDLAVTSGIRSPLERTYHACSFVGGTIVDRNADIDASESGLVCAPIRRDRAASLASPNYWVVEISALTRDRVEAGPLRIHFYDLGQAGIRIVGLERPNSNDASCPLN
jgi:hypothetical protein